MKDYSQHPLAQVVLCRWETFLHARSACLKNDTVDNIHDLRVATRRLRASLQLVASIISGRDMSHVYSAISKVTREIGFLRNLDETLIFVRNDCSAGEFGGLIEKISRKRIREAARVHRHLKRLDADSMERSVYAAISKLSGNKAALLESGLIGFLSDRSINMFRDIHALLPSVQDEEAFEMRHALRIAIKHWRYFLEILAELTGKDYDAVLDDLKAYQTILGRLNDIAVFSSYAESWNMSATDRDLFESVAADARTSALAALAGIVFARPLRYSFL